MTALKFNGVLLLNYYLRSAEIDLNMRVNLLSTNLFAADRGKEKLLMQDAFGDVRSVPPRGSGWVANSDIVE